MTLLSASLSRGLMIMGVVSACLPALGQPAPSASSPAASSPEAVHQRARRQCDKLWGNEKEVCEAAARLERVQADAARRMREDQRPGVASEAFLAIAEAEHDLAQQMCDDLKGAEAQACRRSAGHALSQARAKASQPRQAPDAVPVR